MKVRPGLIQNIIRQSSEIIIVSAMSVYYLLPMQTLAIYHVYFSFYLINEDSFLFYFLKKHFEKSQQKEKKKKSSLS